MKGHAEGCEAKAGIVAWMAFYSRRGMHKALGYRTPMEAGARGLRRQRCGHVEQRGQCELFG